MTLSLFATCRMLLMATMMTMVTSMPEIARTVHGDSEDSYAGDPLTWTITAIPMIRTVTNSEIVTFVGEHSTTQAELQDRLSKIGGLAATYSLPLIFHALKRLLARNALWATEMLHAFAPNYALEWIETPDAIYNYGTAFYYDIRYPANSFDDALITQMDINWEPTAEDFTLGETASTLNLLLYLTLFGTSAHLINKVTVAEQSFTEASL